MTKDRRTKVELIEDIAKLQNRLVELRCEFENLKHEMWLKEQTIMELRTKLDQIPLVERFKQDRVGMLDEEGPARDCNWCRYGTVRHGSIFYFSMAREVARPLSCGLPPSVEEVGGWILSTGF